MTLGGIDSITDPSTGVAVRRAADGASYQSVLRPCLSSGKQLHSASVDPGMADHVMSDIEVQAFLRAMPPRTAKLATTRADGRPHVAPVWFDLDDDGSLVFTTGEATVKGRGLQRDPRVALSVDDERPPFTFVVMEGRATLSRDSDELLRWATRIGGRYMGDARAEEYGRRNAVPEELLVRVRLERIVAAKDIAA
jgi:PPOX class probable F420-dependent enzyme